MRYNIAGIIVDMNVQHPRVTRQAEAYIYEGDRPTNVTIELTDEFFEARQAEYPHMDHDTIEYIWLGAEFYNALIHFGGILLHSSCVVKDDRAYLFSAPCGTGKSTHTQIWLKRYPDAYILNDDKPALRVTDDGIYAFGTPFSGKTDLNVNKAVKVGGICIIVRDTTNHIERISTDEALFYILNQTVRPADEDVMDKVLTTLDKIITNVPVYRLGCNMELEAAEVSFKGMREDDRNEN